MEKNFIRVRSAKDITVFATLVIAGSVLVALPTSSSVNILGFFMIFTGVLLAIFMKTGYKEQESGTRFCKREIFFDKSRQSELSKAIQTRLSPSDVKEANVGNGIRLDIYHSKATGTSFVQLYEYVPYKYEPCTIMYEHPYENVSEILK